MDSSASRGLALAVQVAADLGCSANCVTTCVVARSRDGEVRGVHVVPPRMVARQMDAVAQARPTAGVIGMLARHQVASAVAGRIARRELSGWVMDPVVGVENGRQMLTSQGARVLARALVPLCEVVCIDAARSDVWPGIPVGGAPSAERAAAMLMELGARSVLVRGVPTGAGVRALVFGPERLDLSWEGRTAEDAERLSAAIACGMAAGLAATEAVIRGLEYVERAAQGKVTRLGQPGVRSEAGDD